MSRRLSYADAARLLGGGESQLVKALDRLTGGLLIAGAAAGIPALLGWLDARTEFVRLSHELVRKVNERRTGLSRYSRTQRLEAAHMMLVVTAYFEALAEADLPFRFVDLALTREEQLAVANRGASGIGAVVDDIALATELLPRPGDAGVVALADYYRTLSGSVAGFVQGLAVWDRLSETDRDRFQEAMSGVPARACTRYDELFRQLAGEFPEVAYWADRFEHRATRAEVREVGVALARLERMLDEISTGRVPDQRRQELARAYRKALERPIVASGETPSEVRLPTLEGGYVAPAFRVGVAHPGMGLNNESWWDEQPVREDLEEYLIGHLTSGSAVEAPLLVLGQPGSGKSVLTKVLAARLPAADFLPVRVALREVPTVASVQDQIEYAIRDTTGERLDWPALARSAGDALPVVILDGFDELLQATAVSQTDYLMRVAEFQRRELDQNRPVAVIVTSRTSVADRARPPDGTGALRLEPFDAGRIGAWLQVWNVTNEAGFRTRGLAPLAAEAVLAHRDLAGQPLLLLMLALYDADGNALQQGTAGLGEYELYEQLLRSFARREVVKLRPGMPDRELDRAVELELRRLSVVAFGMFNRGSLWITEADLDSDLRALLGEATPAPAGDELRAPLRAAELVLGRFFFVHQAQAIRDDTRLETYEFLHATFGEFLVARFTWQVLRDIAAREAASTMSLSATPIDDDLLHALLSFGVLSQRAPTVDFLTDLAAQSNQPDRSALVYLLVRLFRAAHHPRPGRGYASYLPRSATVPARHAAYSANLVLLTVCVNGQIRASELFGPVTDVIEAWRAEAMLWRSQLVLGWVSVLEAFAVHRLWEGDQRDLRLELDRGSFQVPAIDPSWTYDWVRPSWRRWSHFRVATRGETAHRTAHFLCLIGEDVTQHVLEPLADAFGATVYMFGGWGQDSSSAIRVLLDVWLLPFRNLPAEEQRSTYERSLDIVTGSLAPGVHIRYAALLLDRLTTDDTISAELAADLLDRFVSDAGPVVARVAGPVVRCGLAHLGRGRAATDEKLAEVVGRMLATEGERLDPALTAAARTRLAGLGAGSGPSPLDGDGQVRPGGG